LKLEPEPLPPRNTFRSESKGIMERRSMVNQVLRYFTAMILRSYVSYIESVLGRVVKKVKIMSKRNKKSIP